MTTQSPYIGRFAPSPTGALHAGSLLAALGSYLQARSRHGQWHVRIEDLDTPRCPPGTADDILRDLERCGFEWDGPIVYQSRRLPAYQNAIERLQQTGKIYPCACSRREITDSSINGIDGPVYPGTCRPGLAQGRIPRALRISTHDDLICFNDLIQGQTCQRLQSEIGDFVLRRADGLFAYQLAVVVDDAELGVSEIVRGADLLSSTPRQIYLQQLLKLPTPGYAHLPVLVNAQGQKLSKQTLAPALTTAEPLAALRHAMHTLSHPPPAEIDTLEAFWQWAPAAWHMANVPSQRTIAAV
ncbi:tRNA glutamyl-Q(34) synthetase GluQRS [Sulfuriferula sp. AH1]|uniref:tRNA glutamyl-Q(34) synthetase GluQRS n=1 Tax=Sulfuriferula sp. AH1 TaxID=1985873 RepID=UPI000B3B76DC|nr:tRNA glutamyl-Q(34) synthetase GluQRS [Sulfuriferula sp. AH1]ARU30411.1 tRNA glutamyl-Q(34) synthetase GluQRS [Sulfuriferula sp. AH1]